MKHGMEIPINVLIGQENRGKRKGVPTIGNPCTIISKEYATEDYVNNMV